MEKHTSQTNLASDQHPAFPLPSATRTSPWTRNFLHALCRAYVRMESAHAGKRWCDALLAMDGGANDEDALVGKGEAALKNEQREEAVKFLERAYEAGGQSDRQVRISQSSLSFFRSSRDCKRLKDC
jgi:DnaJ homolog subfamily C member 3